MCDGQPPQNYCDCAGDCTANPDWCACEEAQSCCEGAPATLVCNGQPPENYCDCSYDCHSNPDWCACEEAQACCEGALDASAEAAKKKHEVAKKKLAQHASVRAAKKKDAERAAVSAHRTKVKSNSGLGKDNSSTAKKFAGPRGDMFTQHARAKAAKGKQFVQRARAKAAKKNNAERAAASAYRAKVKSDSYGRADSGNVVAE